MAIRTDVLIIGGGLAGLTAAIHLARGGVGVVVLEKQPYPHHKVCGEYISNEVLPYLESLELDVASLHPSRMNRFLLTTPGGQHLHTELPQGGFGVSRYELDQFFYHRALLEGVEVRYEQATNVVFSKDAFAVTTLNENQYEARYVIGAYGKRSPLDTQTPKSPWMAIKGHYEADFPEDLVSLHTFPGGYCGLSPVENQLVNACYLVRTEAFKPYKNPEEFQKIVVSKNPYLADFFKRATPVFDKPIAISQVSFARKKTVENHVLRCGDTAGLIHPLCGNGMAMAIHSAKLAAELILYHSPDRAFVEKSYTQHWNRQFRTRLRAGKWVQSGFQYGGLTEWLVSAVTRFPGIVPLLVRQTHGEPMAAGPELVR